MSQQQPIVIKGKTAREIYKQILKQDKCIHISNEGTVKNPVLRLEGC